MEVHTPIATQTVQTLVSQSLRRIFHPNVTTERFDQSYQECRPMEVLGGTRRLLVVRPRFSSGSSCSCASGLQNRQGKEFFFLLRLSDHHPLGGALNVALRLVDGSAQSFADLLFLKFTAVLGLVHVGDSGHSVANTVGFRFSPLEMLFSSLPPLFETR